MAKYRVKGPDGATYEVNAPDGASEADVMAYVQQQHAGQSKQAHYADLQRRAAALPQSDPTAGNSFGQNAVLGFGKAGMDTARGIGQMLGVVDRGSVDEARRLDAPLNHTGGGVVGNLVGQGAQMLALPEVRGATLLGRAAPYVNAAAQGALFNAAQGVGTGESRGQNAVVGGALGIGGQGIAKGAGALASSAKNALNPVVQDSIELAKRAGIPLHLSQVTGSKALKTVASALNYLPFSGAGKAGQAQQQAFNAAVGRSFGTNAPVLSDQVMQDARQRLSNEFNSIYQHAQIPATQNAVRRMLAVEQQAASDLVDSDAALVSKQFQKIVDKLQNGPLSGDQYQALRTSLGDAASGTKAGKFIKQLRSELDDMAKSSLGPQDAARLTKAHGQWANMRTAEKALKQVGGAAGNVAPHSLWGVIRNGSTAEMRKLAQIGQNVLKDPIPDSGTAARDLVYKGLSLGGGAGAASALGVLAPAAKLAATGVTAARFLNSPAAAKLLGQGWPTSALARLLQGAPKALPLLTPAVAGAQERKR